MENRNPERNGKFRMLVDADALPGPVKEIICRAALRLSLETIFIASKHIQLIGSNLLKCEVVEIGADAADNAIVEKAGYGDLVITADVPLADRVLARGADAIDPREDLYTVENIKTKLAMRDLSKMLRDSGEMTGGPRKFGVKDTTAFARSFDALLTRKRGRG